MYTAWGDFIVKRPIKETVVKTVKTVEGFYNGNTEYNEFMTTGKSANNTIIFKSTKPSASFIEPGGTDRLVSKRKGSCTFTYNGSQQWYVTINGNRVLGPYNGHGVLYFDIWAGDVIIINTDNAITIGALCSINLVVSTSKSQCNALMAPDFATVDTRLITNDSCIWQIADPNMNHQAINQNQASYCYCLNDQMPNVDVPRIDLPTKDTRKRDKLKGTYE
jgi:hypothetical protein